MKTLNERVDDLENKYEFIEKGIVNLAVNFGKMRTEMETRFSALETRFDTLETRFSAMESRFDTLETRFSAMETRFGTLETRFSAMETRFDALDKKVNRIVDMLTGDR